MNITNYKKPESAIPSTEKEIKTEQGNNDAMKALEIYEKVFTEIIKREGAAELFEYLKNETDFFIAPASTNFHSNFKGGLASHSVQVYKNLRRIMNTDWMKEMFGIAPSEETMAIVALLHDICKVNNYIYKENARKYKDDTLKNTLQNRFNEESVRLKKQEAALKAFCKETGRRYESARVQIHAVKNKAGDIVGFNRSVAQKAVWQDRKNTFKNQMSKQLEKLAEEEKKAIWRYTGNAANRVNSAIYSGKQQRIDREKGFMDLLDSALSKGIAEHKMVVHRDTIPEYLNAFPKGFQYSEEDIKRMNGMTLTNKGYTSTSFHDIMYQGRNVHLEIEIPKGYKGCLYIKDVATEKYKNQEEVLFKRGFQYKIKSVNKEKDRYYIKAEAVL